MWTKALGTAAVLVMSMTLAACGQGGAAKDQTLKIYNWSDYIDPQILADFTQETGIKVQYDTFDSNEILETKVLQGNTGYDIVAPSNHNVPRYVTAGAIAQLDKSKLPNNMNLWPDIMSHMEPFDPGQKYTVPYMWGTIGIGYNPEKVKAACRASPSTAGRWCSIRSTSPSSRIAASTISTRPRTCTPSP